ncbi:MAG: molybdate ABC transporter substrate-binding protein [Methylacidiphilales bacterium]|nr:molybdate ABC transporter substrate-binding protein [Candidatus Methylacidiphilales bacterium]
MFLPRFRAGFVLALGWMILGAGQLGAEPVTPAQPADPNQARPAVPVIPDSAIPVPAMPATNEAAAAPAPAPTSVVGLTIIADSSLRQVLQELAQNWADNQDSSPQVPLTLTNAGTLKAKVEGGAVWDVVICADVADMKELTDKGLIAADGQRSLARNTLVIYGRKALIKDDELDWFDLIGNEWKKVALGNPDLTASGRVAKRALVKHSLYDDDEKSLYTFSPTELLALGNVQRDAADAAFVYKTDLAGVNLPGFDVYPLKSEDAPPVFYVAGISRLAKNLEQAKSFLDFCTGETGKAIWAKYGFETN